MPSYMQMLLDAANEQGIVLADMSVEYGGKMQPFVVIVAKGEIGEKLKQQAIAENDLVDILACHSHAAH